jgi:pectate lyase-like protein
MSSPGTAPARLADMAETESSMDIHRRAVLAQLGAGGAALTGFTAAADVSARPPAGSPARGGRGWYDVKEDFDAHGDGNTDDTRALQLAINAGSESQRPVNVPPGVYPISQPLIIPSNTMLIGSAPGLGFGCRIEPSGCPAFTIGGNVPSFHCSIESLMIWPKGAAPDCIISIDNSYSIALRNVRIHEAQHDLKRAAVVLLGDTQSGGHGRCNNIIWENLIVRNDSAQPHVAILAAKGCGSHRFIAPCLENYGVLLEWQGGQLDMVVPYTERAGRYAVNCNLDGDAGDAYLNTFGGSIDCANSGLGCAIRSTTKNFNSFGTVWAASADRAAYVYSLPELPAIFHGIVPNLGNSGKARFSGVQGWRRSIRFPQQRLGASQPVNIPVPAHGAASAAIAVPGVERSEHWARATFNSDAHAVQLSAFVSGPGMVTVAAYNTGDTQITLGGVICVECGIA